MDGFVEAVVDVCRGRSPELPAADAVRRSFLNAVRHHRVAPLAHAMARSSDPELAAELKPDRDVAMIQHLTATVVVDQLGQLLDGLDWAAIKGPVLSEHAHPAPGLRSYHDVDVLVSPGALREAAARLLGAGWRVVDYRDMLCNADTPGEMHWAGPAGVLVDLHWSLINMSQSRRRFSVDTDQLLGRRTRVPLGGSRTWTLDPADSLVHVCLHAALTGADKMLLLLDADQLARHIVDWDDVTSRAHAWGAGPAVAIVLARARALLETPLPAGFGRDLGTSIGFRLVTGAADRVSPVPRLRRDASLARLVARSVRADSASTLTAIGRRGLRGLTERLGVTGRGSTARVREPADRAALETYVGMVEAAARARS